MIPSFCSTSPILSLRRPTKVHYQLAQLWCAKANVTNVGYNTPTMVEIYLNDNKNHKRIRASCCSSTLTADGNMSVRSGRILYRTWLMMPAAIAWREVHGLGARSQVEALGTPPLQGTSWVRGDRSTVIPMLHLSHTTLYHILAQQRLRLTL